MVSITTSNTMSKIAFNTGYSAATGALTGLIIGQPVGPVAGALFGAVRHFSLYPISFATDKVLNTNKMGANTEAKTIKTWLSVLGSHAVAWAALSYAGFPLTLIHVVTLAVVDVFSTIVLNAFLDCFKNQPKRPAIVL